MAKSPYPGHPIFDTADRLADMQDAQQYPTLYAFFREACPEGVHSDFKITAQFLRDHEDVSGTYNRFKGELQRFLLYTWVVGRRTLNQVDSETIELYFRFMKNPPEPWIADGIRQAFLDHQGVRIANDLWRPFVNRRGGKYLVKQSSLDASHRALSAYFRFLQNRRHIEINPLLDVRRRSRKAQISKGHQEDTTARRLTDWQWSFMLETLTRLADENSKYERHLFAVVSLKSLYLRVSELAPRPDGSGEDRVPTFGDFGKKALDGDFAYSLYVFGKGEKPRRVTVADRYIPYLKRYRKHLGLTPMPSPGDPTPFFSSKNGSPLGRRQVTRIVEEAFALTSDAMKAEGHMEDADRIIEINKSTHVLRHTGASQDIHAGRPLRDVSEDLGHSSPAFTDSLYVSSDEAMKYHIGRQRHV